MTPDLFNKCKPFTQTSETAVRLMLRYPWFMGLYYSMRIFESRDLPYKTLMTNGVSIWVDPDFWSQLSKEHRMTAVAHELGHKMFFHHSRMGERDPRIWNIAGDHVINLVLKESDGELVLDHGRERSAGELDHQRRAVELVLRREVQGLDDRGRVRRYHGGAERARGR